MLWIHADPEVLAAMWQWKQIIDVKGRSVVGIAKVTLEKKPCSVGECNLANFMADAMVHHYITSAQGMDDWNGSIVGLVPSGDIRTSINKGGMSDGIFVKFSFQVFLLNRFAPQ